MKIILFVLLTIIIPMYIGGIIENISSTKLKDIYSVLAFRFVIGNATQWTIFQLIAVPLILLKVKFMVLVIAWSVVTVCFIAIYILRRGKTVKRQFDIGFNKVLSDNITLIVIIGIAVSSILYQCYKYVRFMHLDEDDSRFIVNAVDAYFNNTMMLTNPTTGEYMGTWVGDLAKDVASPWMMYVAMLAKLCMIHPTIVAHTLLPVLLLIASYCAYYLMGNVIFKNDVQKSFIFLVAIVFTNMYFSDSIYTQSVFSLVRIWQGKATMAAVMIPLMLYLVMKAYAEDNRSNYLLVLIACMAMCLMSGMGIFFSGIMAGTYGGYFVIIKKKWRDIPFALFTCLPTIIYGMLYAFIK